MKGPIHAGPKQIAATGKSFKIPSSIICKVEEGRIGEVRIYFDVLDLVAQLGLGPDGKGYKCGVEIILRVCPVK
jgi:hypothetical protein